MRLAHTIAGIRQLASWAQARLTTSLFCLGLLLAAWHFKNIDGGQLLALEEIDDLLARIAPVDIAHRAGGHRSYLPDDLRGVATDMTATIEAVDPEDLPFLRELADNIDCEYMRDAAPNIERMIKGYQVFVEEDWLKSRGLQDNDRLRGVIRRVRGDGYLINQLCDPATRLGGRYLKRIEEFEAHYGGEVPKDKHGYPLLWFGLCTNDFSQVCQLAHRALSRMLFKCNQEQVVRDEDFEITISFPAFTVLIDAWCALPSIRPRRPYPGSEAQPQWLPHVDEADVGRAQGACLLDVGWERRSGRQDRESQHASSDERLQFYPQLSAHLRAACNEGVDRRGRCPSTEETQ